MIEWPTVKAVIIGMSGFTRRNGMTKQRRNNIWSMPVKMCSPPSLMKLSDAPYQVGSRGTRPEPPEIHDRATGSVERGKRKVSLTASPIFGADESSRSRRQIWRGDWIGEMNIEIAELKGYLGVRRRRGRNSGDGLVIFLNDRSASGASCPAAREGRRRRPSSKARDRRRGRQGPV